MSEAIMSDDNILYCLETLSGFEPDDIECDDFDIAVNDDQFAQMSIVRSAKFGADLIKKLQEKLDQLSAQQNEWISVDGAALKYNTLYHVLLKNKMIIVCRFNDYKSLGGHTNYWQDLNHNDISMDGTMFIEIATPTPPKEI